MNNSTRNPLTDNLSYLEGELPFAPIGPNAKAAALYLRHGLKLPYRKINIAMKTLFGLDFVAV